MQNCSILELSTFGNFGQIHVPLPAVFDVHVCLLSVIQLNLCSMRILDGDYPCCLWQVTNVTSESGSQVKSQSVHIIRTA